MNGKRNGGIYYFDPLGNAPETDIHLSDDDPHVLKNIFKGHHVKYNKMKFQAEKIEYLRTTCWPPSKDVRCTG